MRAELDENLPEEGAEQKRGFEKLSRVVIGLLLNPATMLIDFGRIMWQHTWE
jgi:hypothetical protein